MSEVLEIDEVLIQILPLFYSAGDGPTHKSLSASFDRSNVREIDPYQTTDPYFADSQATKTDRVRLVLGRTVQGDGTADRLIRAIVADLHSFGTINSDEGGCNSTEEARLKKWLGIRGWKIDEHGQIVPAEHLDLQTGGRQAIDEHLARLKASRSDGSQRIGAAKELLESIAKLVHDEFGIPYGSSPKYEVLMHRTFKLLDLLPNRERISANAHVPLDRILGASKTIVSEIVNVRNRIGTGHGRNEALDVDLQVARFVVEQALMTSQLILDALDASKL